jgi:hypothetical protein
MICHGLSLSAILRIVIGFKSPISLMLSFGSAPRDHARGELHYVHGSCALQHSPAPSFGIGAAVLLIELDLLCAADIARLSKRAPPRQGSQGVYLFEN